MLASGHAAMHEAAAAQLGSAGWTVSSEVTFSIYGERGAIDVLAWHPQTRSLLVVELKTTIIDVQELLAAVDRYRRLAPRIARERGWDAVAVSVWVALRDRRTNRSRLAAHAAVLRNALPADGRSIHAWLRHPSGSIAGLSFLPNSSHESPMAVLAGRQRVRTVVARSALGGEVDHLR